MKNIRVILKRLFAIFLCTGIISCSAYGKYTVAYAAGEELAAGLIGYIPFSTAFFSAAAALGVTGASLAGVLSQENGNADLTAAQKAAESAIAKQSGLKTLYNGVNVVKSYVSDKVNYFSNAFMTAVAEALNSKGLLTNKSSSIPSIDVYKTIDLKDYLYTTSELFSIQYFNYRNLAIIDWWQNVGYPALINRYSDYYIFAGSLSEMSYLYLIKSSDLDMLDDISVHFYSDDSEVLTKFNLRNVPIISILVNPNLVDPFTSFTSRITSVYGGWTYHLVNNELYVTSDFSSEYCLLKPISALNYSSSWSVTSNLPKFGTSALLETMPTWAGATTTIPAGTVDSSTEEQVAYPVTIPAGDKALTNGLTADDLQDLTQDQAQAGSIDTTTDITDLSAVTQAITGAADQTAANFDTLFGWLDQILSAIKAIPAAIADAISSAFAFQQSSFDGLILPTEITKKFPFCIPFDIADCLRLFQTDEREAPHYEYTLKYSDQANTIVIDLSQFDDIAKLVRSLEFIGFLVGLAFATRYLIRG